MRLDISVGRDFAQVTADLEDMVHRTEDGRPAFARMADSFIRMEQRHFQSEGAYGSGGWHPLSGEYAEWKARRYPGKPILQREGDLYKSLTGGPGFIKIVQRDIATFGTSIPYAGFHQSGTSRMPARPPVPHEIPAAVRGSWTRAMRDHPLGRKR